MSTTDRAELTKIFAENFNSSLGIKMEKSGRAYELETFADDFFSRLNNEYNKNFIKLKNHLNQKKGKKKLFQIQFLTNKSHGNQHILIIDTLKNLTN